MSVFNGEETGMFFAVFENLEQANSQLQLSLTDVLQLHDLNFKCWPTMV